MAEVAALILAAGRGTRFGAEIDGSKAFADFRGRPLVAHAAAAAIASRARPVLVVTGQGAARAPAALAGLGVQLVHNPCFAEGMAGSIAVGIAKIPTSAVGVLVMLADMPLVRSDTLDALIAAFERERPDAVVPVHRGRRGNPGLIARSLFPALEALRGDEGARSLFATGDAKVVGLEVDDPGILVDVDTKQALAALDASRS